MISINLLPKEERVSHTPSAARLLVIAASAVVALISFGVYATIHFGELKTAQEAMANAADQRQQLESKGIEKKNKDLGNLVKALGSREKAVEQVRLARSETSRQLYEFAQIFRSNSVWIKNLNVKTEKTRAAPTRRRGRKAAPVKVTAPMYKWDAGCESAGGQLQDTIKFHRDLQNVQSFAEDLVNIKVPVYSKITLPDELEINVGYSFSLEMFLRVPPPEKEDPKDKKKPKGT